MWDAWDVDEFYRNTVTDLVDADEVVPGEDGVSVLIVRSFGASRVAPGAVARAGGAASASTPRSTGARTEKFLKLAFPLDVHAERYASETQSALPADAHRTRPREAAKFEACNHRFVHMEEPGWGVALVNDSTYGHDVTRTVRDSDSGTTTTVASRCCVPALPDPETDQGVHRFRHALVRPAWGRGGVRGGGSICRSGG